MHELTRVGQHANPGTIVGLEVLVVLLVAVGSLLRCEQADDLGCIVTDAFGSEVDTEKLSCVLINLLDFDISIIDLQEVIGEQYDQHVLGNRVASGSSLHVLGALLLHSNVHVVVLNKRNRRVLREYLRSLQEWVLLKAEGVQSGLHRESIEV